MGDAVRNLEEQIRGVEGEIRGVEGEIQGVEGKIRGVEGEIRGVEGKIERVEHQIETCSNLQERARLDVKETQFRAEKEQLRGEKDRLRAEKQQLRGEKDRLRAEKEQLRVEKAQLQEQILQGRDASDSHPRFLGNLTWTEWLNQRLPPLLFSFSARSGLRPAKDEFIPAAIIRWDLWPDVDQYVADAVTKSSRHERIDLRVCTQTRIAFSEADCCFIYQTLLGNIGSVVLGDKFDMSAEEWSRSSSITQQRETADINRGALNDPSPDLSNVIELVTGNPQSGLKVDILLKCTGRAFLAVEMKRPSFFRGAVDQNPPDLVKAYEDKDLRFLDGQRSHVIAQSITQLFRYLVNHEIGYGIISSADLSYLVSRVDDSLRISEGICWSDPKFIGALAYFLERAATDSTPYVWGGGGKHSQDCDIVVSQETQDASSDDEEYGAPKKLKMTPTAGSVTRSMSEKICLNETPVEHLHLEAHPFATGWSGNVVRGIYEGHVVAVKLALVCSDRAEALINEASAYLKLQKYWGKYVPALIAHGTTANGNIVYIATELIKGFELGMERLTPGVVTASFKALTAIHASGMLHGDIRRENILVPKGGRRGVRFIDFGFARSDASADDCCEELAQLQYIVSRLSFRGSVRVASTAGVIDRGRHLEAEAYQNLP